MTARKFLDGFQIDQRLVTGGYFSQEPVQVRPGDRVGVVLMNHGGPGCPEDLGRFLYNALMDPAAVDLPLPALFRDPLSRLVARRQARKLERGYEQIGGASPVTRHSEEQARALEQRLNDRFGPLTGATFKTYVAMRYAPPSCEETAERMREDGITSVVLLPLHPHYSTTTTGSSLAYWKWLEARQVLPARPTTFVYEYAAHPKFVQALAERIDEGLQRFPLHVRDRIAFVFVAQGAPQKALDRHQDPYCCLVHATVQQVMAHRAANDPGRLFRVAFQEPLGPGKGLEPSTPETLEHLVDEGHTAMLVVPVSFVSDHVETAFGLDIALREEASALGVEHYEVTSGLNCHPLFVEGLAECIAAQLAPAGLSHGDGADALPTALPALPRYKVGDRTVRCPQCPFVCEAHDWSGQPAVRVPAPVAPTPTDRPQAA